jgi:RND superfamily putative drug exporter
VLETLARAATRRPLTVILLWTLFLLLGFGLGTGVFGRLSDEVPNVPGTESQRAAEYLRHADPAGDTVVGVVEGAEVAGPALRRQVERAVAEVRAVGGIAAVPDPYTTRGLVAADGRALLIPVTLEGGLDDAAEERAVDAAAERIRRIDAPEVHVSGGPLLGTQMGERAQRDVRNAELISLPVVLVLLLVVFGGLRAAGLPLLVAVSGIAGAFLALFGFSQVTGISVYAIQVTTMLGLGLAVDYALLLLVRFREERRHTAEVTEAVHRTVAAAGRTVLFSGLTVAVSLTGLLVFPSTFLRSMGLAVAAVVVVDMLAALTLLPALLARFGGRIAPAKERPAGEEGRVFARLARFAARRRVAVLAVVVPVLLVLALPVTGMRIAIGDARQLPSHTEARQLYDTVDAHFPPGTGVSPVLAVLRPGTDPATAARIRALSPGAQSGTLPDGTEVVRLRPSGRVDGASATALVERVRELRGTQPVQVTGTAARLVDFRAMLADRAPWAALTVLAGILVLLFAFTGSVLVPLRTIATAAQPGRRAGRGGVGVPGRASGGPAGRRWPGRAEPDRAAADRRDRLRTRHGLRAVHPRPDAGGPAAHRRRPAGRGGRAAPLRSRGDLRGPAPRRRLRRVHDRRVLAHPADRPGPDAGGADRRDRRPDAAGAGDDDAAGPVGVVGAGTAAPAARPVRAAGGAGPPRGRPRTGTFRLHAVNSPCTHRLSVLQLLTTGGSGSTLGPL